MYKYKHWTWAWCSVTAALWVVLVSFLQVTQHTAYIPRSMAAVIGHVSEGHTTAQQGPPDATPGSTKDFLVQPMAQPDTRGAHNMTNHQL